MSSSETGERKMPEARATEVGTPEALSLTRSEIKLLCELCASAVSNNYVYPENLLAL